MARFIPPHPKKGSPEAYAWAERMRALRKRIRRAGRKTEKMFFRKGKLKKFGGMELNPSKKKWRKVKAGDIVRLKHLVRGMNWHIDEPLRIVQIAYHRGFSEPRMLADGHGQQGWIDPYHIEPIELMNPGASWHEQEERSARKARRESVEIPEKTFYAGVESAHRISASAARRMGLNPKRRRARKNPIAIYGLGNPGGRINAKIEGVIYNRVIEVRAEKTGSWKPGFYRHPFAKRSKVCLLALDNGDILIHSRSGKKLWEPGT